MRVTYSGPFEAVEVPALGVVIERGSATEVPDDIGKSLCKQNDWKESGRKSSIKDEPER